MSLREMLGKRKTVLLREPLVKKLKGQELKPDRRMLAEGLGKMITDEIAGELEYREFARSAYKQGLPDVSKSLSKIADDEREHRRILEKFMEQLV